MSLLVHLEILCSTITIEYEKNIPSHRVRRKRITLFFFLHLAWHIII